ncbi:ubiquitin-conjugating enzyme E2 S [Geranomyces variabilis]|uniref:E2 ubiquitin-conjugating enzyme n=1 Tax=Geranomyces variabilis TaxID=109894 RepID=A0AAD5XTP2_9FUNG|nr:ubiquitin-conjugating enzyme E2 S [Geranomyces variabilis]
MACSENHGPAVIKRLSKELATLASSPSEGIKVVINSDRISDVQAWIQGPEGTPYENGCFRVRLSLGADFPNVPPQGHFLTKIFHPNVSRTGEICVNVLKKEWRKEYGIGHILLTIKCLLIDPNPESALNEEAGRLLLEDYAAYAKHARLMTTLYAINKSISFETTSAAAAAAAATSGKNSSSQENENPPADKMFSKAAAAAAGATGGVGGGGVVGGGVGAAEAAEVLGVSNGPASPKKKRVAEKKVENVKTDKKRTLRRL